MTTDSKLLDEGWHTLHRAVSQLAGPMLRAQTALKQTEDYDREAVIESLLEQVTIELSPIEYGSRGVELLTPLVYADVEAESDVIVSAKATMSVEGMDVEVSFELSFPACGLNGKGRRRAAYIVEIVT